MLDEYFSNKEKTLMGSINIFAPRKVFHKVRLREWDKFNKRCFTLEKTNADNSQLNNQFKIFEVSIPWQDIQQRHTRNYS